MKMLFNEKEILAELEQEAQELPEDFKDGDWQYSYSKEHKSLQPSSEAEAAKSRQKGNEAMKQKAVDKKMLQKQIINEAVCSEEINLNAPLTVYHKRLLISLLTSTYTEKMEKNENYINSFIEKAVASMIPKDVMKVWQNNPDTMIPCPGFVYQASTEYGEGHGFKVSLNLPMYFKDDDTYNGILHTHYPEKLPMLDKAVALFYKNKETRTKREVQMAQKLARVSTFFQLIKCNAFWYKALIDELKQRNEL